MPLVEIPVRLPGKVFSSPMPYSRFDPEGMLIQEYKDKDISIIVVLISMEESVRRAGRNLIDYYTEEGFRVIHLPIPDFGVPSHISMDTAIESLLDYLNRGENAVVHCNAGLGRTGTFLACLAKRVHEISAGEAINWIRQYIPEAIETPEQARFVQEY